MIKIINALVLLLVSLSMFTNFATTANSHELTQQSIMSSQAPTPVTANSQIRVTIASVGPMLGPPTTRYRIGEQIPVTIKLTNTTSQPVYACLSGDLYQDLPRLTKNDRVVPYTSWQTYLLRTAYEDATCLREDLPDRMMLKPNEASMVDSMVVVDDALNPTGAVAWYDALTPGHYELSVQRRFDCCDGPTVESNKIDFDVTQ